MANEIDTLAYMMAAEKMINLLFVMEQTVQFMQEYKIEPDEEVKKALIPMIEQLKEWLKQ
jgi:hypothetical protein